MAGKSNFDNSLKVLVKSSFFVFIGVFISKIVLYLYRVVIARTYGSEDYGLFSLAMMILILFTTLALLGLNEGVLRFIPIFRGKKEEYKIRYLMRFSIKVALTLSIFFGALLFLLSDIIAASVFHNIRLSIFLKISSLAIPFYALSNILLSAIRGFENVGWYSFIVNIFQNVIKLLAILLLVFLGLNGNFIMISYVLGIMATFFLAFHVYKKKVSILLRKSQINVNSKSNLKKELFSYSLPLMFSTVLSLVYFWVDSFALGYIKGVSDVGYYNAVVPIAMLLPIVSDLFIQIFYPSITKEYSKKNFFLVREVSKQVGKWIISLALPLFIIMFLFPGAVINFLFGSEYIVATNALRILALASFISILNGLFFTLLSIAGKSKTIFVDFLTTSLLNLILNFILIQKYGLNGAAISTGISWVVLTILLVYQIYSIFGFVPVRKKILKVFLVSLIPLAVLLLIKKVVPQTLLFLLPIGILFFLIYFLILLISRCFDKNDLMILSSLKKKVKGIFHSSINF